MEEDFNHFPMIYVNEFTLCFIKLKLRKEYCNEAKDTKN